MEIQNSAHQPEVSQQKPVLVPMMKKTSICEFVGRIVLGILATLVSIGFALIFKDVRNLFKRVHHVIKVPTVFKELRISIPKKTRASETEAVLIPIPDETTESCNRPFFTPTHFSTPHSLKLECVFNPIKSEKIDEIKEATAAYYNDGKLISEFTLLQLGHGKTIGIFPNIDPNIVVKVCTGSIDTIKERYMATAQMRYFCWFHKLDKIVIPKQSLVTFKTKEGHDKHLLLEEKLDVEEKEITGDDEDSIELLRQFTTFVYLSGYWDIKPDNNPYIKGENKLALLDLEFIKLPRWRKGISRHPAFNGRRLRRKPFYRNFTPKQKIAMSKALNALGAGAEFSKLLMKLTMNNLQRR